MTSTARSPVRVIVNADDLGMSAAVNAAIERCLDARTITSATILANGPAFDQAIDIARRHPEASFGVHLNATEFAPVSSVSLGPLTADGVFVNRVREVALTPALLGAIEIELDAQIARVKATGLPVSHLDSHHHIHTVPRLLPLTLRLARRHAVPFIRQSRNVFRSDEQPSIILRAGKSLWNAALTASGRRRTRYFGSLDDVMNAAAPIPAGSSIEVMVHPGGASNFIDETDQLGKCWWERAGLEPRWETYAS